MRKFDYDAAIAGGLGHVGLPLGIVFAKRGKKIILYDIDEQAIALVKAGKMPFSERGAQEQLQEVLGKTLEITSEKSVLSKARFIIISLGTPLDEHLNPEFGGFQKFFSEILDYLHDEQHIIIRSTIFPGTTEKLIDFLKSKGKKTKVSFCPERIAEGKAMEELVSLPQIVASLDDVARQEAKELFSILTDRILFLTPKEAEIAKLIANTWRYIQFAISNQFYVIATQNDVDFYRIYEAVTYDYPRLKGLPKAGFAAGPCLFKDTMQLAAYSNNVFFLGHAAMLINEGLPNFIVQQLKQKNQLAGKTVGILGMAFKADSDDSRESLSYKLKKILERDAKEVLCTDPYVRDPNLVGLQEVMEKSDIIILGAPHSVYKQIRMPAGKKVIDVWGFFAMESRV
jgi:UDP-N-acetyl-D-mannosaminuronic acid dehydrogenase